MSLSDRVSALATRVGEEFKTVRTEMAELGAPDELTIQKDGNQELQARDVAIEGDASDLASLRGQIGDIRLLGGGKDKDLNELLESGRYHVQLSDKAAFETYHWPVAGTNAIVFVDRATFNGDYIAIKQTWWSIKDQMSDDHAKYNRTVIVMASKPTKVYFASDWVKEINSDDMKDFEGTVYDGEAPIVVEDDTIKLAVGDTVDTKGGKLNVKPWVVYTPDHTTIDLATLPDGALVITDEEVTPAQKQAFESIASQPVALSTSGYTFKFDKENAAGSTVSVDSPNAFASFSDGDGSVTIKKTGDYNVNAYISFDAAQSQTASDMRVVLHHNGTPYETQPVALSADTPYGEEVAVSASIKCAAGDAIDLTLYGADGNVYVNKSDLTIKPFALAVEAVPLTVEEVLAPNYFTRGELFRADKTTVTVPAGMVVKVGESVLKARSDQILQLADLGDVETLAGKDVYIYACREELSGDPLFKLSLNSTVPDGYDAGNSRKVGGFHCLCSAVGDIAGHALSGWNTGEILPTSVWDLKHRARSENEGMVYDSKLGLWVDIYLASWDSAQGALASFYLGNVVTGTVPADHALTGEDFVEEFSQVGKRLPFRDEFQVFAFNSNNRTNIANSADPVTTGGHVDTAGRRMVSDLGVEDACGAFWQVTADLMDGGAYGTIPSFTSREDLYMRGYNWNLGGMSSVGTQYGSAFGFLRRTYVGGHWIQAANCGSRCAHLRDASARELYCLAARGVSEPRVVNF